MFYRYTLQVRVKLFPVEIILLFWSIVIVIYTFVNAKRSESFIRNAGNDGVPVKTLFVMCT